MLSRSVKRVPSLSHNSICCSQQWKHFSAGGVIQTSRNEKAREVENYGPLHMTSSEAFVETLLSHNVTDIFGIVGSAFMDALDIFPEAGIRFIPVQHEQNAVHMADAYSRISGKHGVCTGQNGPGITNFVTGLAAAYWAHSPVVAITPESGTLTKGLGGFQEIDQLPIFEAVTKYQGHVNNPQRIAEITSRAFDIAMYERGPTQINIPRDYFYAEHTYTIPKPKNIVYPCADSSTIKQAVQLIMNAKHPCILAGGGVLMSGQECIKSVQRLAHFLGAPVATTYLHNDSYPCNDKLAVGPLGYQGSQAAMNCIKNSDVIIAVGSRMNPFGTLPQYDMEYWPSAAKVIQIEIDSRRLGLSKPCDVYIHGDANNVVQQILQALNTTENENIQCLQSKQVRFDQMQKMKKDWELLLNDWTYNQPHLVQENKIRPRTALRELEKAMPSNAMVATDIGNICSVANSYLNFEESPSFLAAMTFGNCQYAFGAAMGAKVAAPHRPAISYAGDGAWGMSLNEVLTCTRENIPVTAVVFNNQQWGAEKKNQVLWFGDRYIGVNLDNPWSYAEIAKSMCVEGIQCTNEDEVGDALKVAIDNQMNEGKTTIIEIMVTRELGDPFRRDAMRLPKRYLEKYQQTVQTQESNTGQPIDL